MKLLNKHTVPFVTMSTEVNKIKKALTDSGTDITSILKTAAQVLAGIVGSVAGLILLIVLVKTMWKAHRGDGAAWEDAANTIAISVIILAMSAAVFAAFF